MDHHGHSHGLTADASVRPALPEDATELGRIQAAAWAQRLPEAAAPLIDAGAFAASWAQAIAAPPSAKHRLLTACDGPRVVGFAAIAPADEATAELVALEVDPEHRREGHGSRLLAAVADILRATGAGALRTWGLEADEDRAAFLASAGLEPLGVRRLLEVGAEPVAEVAYGATFAD